MMINYVIDLLEKRTFESIPYSKWIKNNTQLKRQKNQKRNKSSPLNKEDLIVTIDLAGL